MTQHNIQVVHIAREAGIERKSGGQGLLFEEHYERS